MVPDVREPRGPLKVLRLVVVLLVLVKATRHDAAEEVHRLTILHVRLPVVLNDVRHARMMDLRLDLLELEAAPPNSREARAVLLRLMAVLTALVRR